ncbi:MAG: DUF3761 domain-containing protein [Patescibacteria group bacterium]
MKTLFYFLVVAVLLVPSSALAMSTSALSGRILLQVEDHGEAWYVNPDDGHRYYMKDGAAAYDLMRYYSLGITNADLEMIPEKNTVDEIKNAASVCGLNSQANRLKGRILLQVESHGEAWYVFPDNCYRVYMRDGSIAYTMMRYLSLGITNSDLANITIETLMIPSTPVTSTISVPLECSDTTAMSTYIGDTANSDSVTSFLNHCSEYLNQSAQLATIEWIERLQAQEDAADSAMRAERQQAYSECRASIDLTPDDLKWLSPTQSSSIIAGRLAVCDVYLQPLALCMDGTLSYSNTRSGTCSWHDGVEIWYY